MNKMMIATTVSIALLASLPLQAQVNGKFAKVDATQGYTVNGSAPVNQTLCGNGTAFVPSTTCLPAPSRTCNANGCYRIAADGTLEEWGTISVPPSGTGTNSATITFPFAFTTTTNLAVTITTVGVAGSGDPNDPPGVQLRTLSAASAAVFMARFIQASEGGGNFDNTITLTWHAIGN